MAKSRKMGPIHKFFRKLEKGHIFVWAFEDGNCYHFYDDGDRLVLSIKEIGNWYHCYFKAIENAKDKGWFD